MAPRPKKQKATTPAFKRGREFKMILPEDISKWVEGEAKDQGRPQSRVIVNHLSRIHYLDQQAKLGELIRDMEIILARYGSRITLADLGEPLLRAVDDVLDAKTDGELRARLDRLRVLRAEMRKSERAAKV
ncbi:hypothetical protein XH99_22325 [Bradyrhizobium nanningense]|uniref:Uncharacterized protein n=1 Tax=Bradyrhizobium nanningense TaxID=1325118 RepID=A0A4V1L1Q1_9BRAD|nr:hypothetical protein [Bradyrhizobium nanningense]RXH25846.1 hypothetical protein XH99_22325 [Bradyrhizobium nanningense]RXH28724.1 hypothetical protein XH84_24020 [Bradyrhizobium nanningense]